jgi:hypothetical protein
MATAAEIQTAYKAFYRVDLNATVAASIASSGVSLDSYIASLNAQTVSTTSAAVAISAFVTGLAPTSAKLDALKVEADKQVASYTALGVANPELGAFEAFGRSFATDTTTTAAFTAKYGALSTADFIGVVYGSVYGATPSAAALANLTGQIEYFTKLYTDNAVPNAAIAAKGAVLGQIVGYAFTSDAANNSNFDNQVATLLSSVAKGDVAGYGKALPAAVNPGAVGVTITLDAGGASVVSPTAADPAFRSTENNDTINGVIATGSIDAGAGADVANLTYANPTLITDILSPTIKNVEVINLDATGAGVGKFAMTNIAGATNVGFKNSTAAGTVTDIALGTTVSVADTTPAAGDTKSATFEFKSATGTSDAATLNLDGAAKATGGATNPTITINAIESLTINASGNASNIILVDNTLKALTVNAAAAFTANAAAATTLESVTTTGSKLVTLGDLSATALKTVDASGSTGGISITTVGGTATSLKGSSAADTFQGITKSGVVVEGGAGNDTITFAFGGADTTSTATVNGGIGADTIGLVNGKITVVYTSQADSTNANFDVVSGFSTGLDKINLAALNLAGGKDDLGTFNTATALAQGNAIFGGKAVAYGTANGATWLVADINNNNVFDVNEDMIVNLTGTAPVIGDILFA